MNENKNKKVAIAMSGGVDSSVAAFLLKEQGYDVTGFFMKFWFESGVEDKRENRCCTIEQFMDVSQVCNKLGISFYTLDFESKFKEMVVDDFLSVYEDGLTPNPCIRCNQFVKFGAYWEKVHELGFDYIATGHYAKKHIDENGKHYIKCSDDQKKDQSYFLYKIPQEILQKTLFPVGEFTKPVIRDIAEKNGFVTARKKGSQELCFVANNNLKGFLKRNTQLKHGNIVNIENDEVLGNHTGMQAYTIGQRKGLGLHGGPWYVCKKDIVTGNVYVTNDSKSKYLSKDNIILKDVHWVSGEKPQLPLNVKARIRYNQDMEDAVVEEKDDQYIIHFEKPRRAVTSGQACVFYIDDYVVGGGVIV